MKKPLHTLTEVMLKDGSMFVFQHAACCSKFLVKAKNEKKRGNVQ